MSRSLAVYELHVKRPKVRKNNPIQQVDSLLNGAGDLLERIEECLSGLHPSALVNDEKNRYVRVQHVARAHGYPRVLQVNLEVGRFGEKGRNRHVPTHAETHSHGAEEAPVVEVRIVFVVPRGATSALMFSERSGAYSATTAVVTALKDYWRLDTQPWSGQSSIHHQSLTYVEAWLKHARLNRVQAVSYGHSSDFSGWGSAGKDLGTLTMTLTPSEGRSVLDRAVWHALRENPAERAKLLGVEGAVDDIDEMMVEVELDGRKKSFRIDNQSSPSIRFDLGDMESDVDHPNHLIQRCLTECSSLYDQLGHDWQTDQVTD